MSVDTRPRTSTPTPDPDAATATITIRSAFDTTIDLADPTGRPVNAPRELRWQGYDPTTDASLWLMGHGYRQHCDWYEVVPGEVWVVQVYAASEYLTRH